MEAKKAIQQCDQCGEEFVIDFANASLSVQIARVNGKTIESRTYIKACPNCQKVNAIESNNPEEWGNRKTPSPKKIFYGLGFGCILTAVAAFAILWFAGKGLSIVWSWLFN